MTNARPDLEVPGPSWREATTAGIITALPPKTRERIRKSGKKFSDDQPRDEHGRFAEVSGNGIDSAIAYGNENLQPGTPLTEEEKAVVGSYVGSGFETLNAGLRGEMELSDQDRRDIAIIDGAIDKSSLPENLMLYRGVGNTEYRDAPQYLNEMRVGSVIKDPAFLSTTLDVDIAQSFAGTRSEITQDGWLMRIEAPAGTPGLFITDEMATSQGETEVLLGRDTPLTVTALDETNRVVTVRVSGYAPTDGKKYSEDQERDAHGRWSSGSSGAALEGDLPAGELSAAHFAGLNEQSQQAVLNWMAEKDVSMTGLMDEIRGRVTGADIAMAALWYPEVRQACDAISVQTDGAITPEQAAAVFAAISPRCEWEDPKTGEGEMKYVPSMAQFVADGKADGMTAEEANLAWRADYSANNENIAASTGEGMRPAFFNGTGEKAFEVLLGNKTPDDILTDNKTRSFYDNIVAPGMTSEVTIDVHMMKAYEQSHGWSYDETVKNLNQGTDNNRTDTHVSSYGYTVVAQAVRNIANEMNLPPDVVQAAYWLQVQPIPHIEAD